MFPAGIDQHRRGPAPFRIGALTLIRRRRNRRVEPRHLAPDDFHIAVRLHGIGQRPQDGVHGIRLHVGIDRDENFAERRIEGGGRPQCLPRLPRRGAVELNHEKHVAARHLVTGDLLHRRDVAGVLQMIEVNRVEGGFSDHRAFARREFADDRLTDRVLARRNGRDLENLFHLARPEIAARFSEWRLRFEHVGADFAFQHDLCGGRDQQVAGFGPRHLDGCAIQRAGKAIFVHPVWDLARGRQQQRRRSPDENGSFQRLAKTSRLLPVDRQMLRRYIRGAADAILPFDHAAIDTEVVRARFRIARDPYTGSDERRRIKTRRGYDMRKGIDSALQLRRPADPRFDRRIRSRHLHGCDVAPMCVCPGNRDLIRRHAQRRRIDGPRTSQCSDQNRGIEPPPLRVRHAAKPERFALFLRKPAELQPNQRHQLRVLADRLLHHLKQPQAAKFVEIIPQIPIRH